MNPEFTVKKTKTCAACNGSGYVQHPHWKAFRAANPDVDFTEQQALAWFEDNDLITIDKAGELPDEEITCAECEGDGKIVTEIDLREAVNEITQAPALDTAFALAGENLRLFRAALFEKVEAVIEARAYLDREMRAALLANKFDGKNAEIREAQAHDLLRVQYADLVASEKDERRARFEFEQAQAALDLVRYRLRIAELTKNSERV